MLALDYFDTLCEILGSPNEFTADARDRVRLTLGEASYELQIDMREYERCDNALGRSVRQEVATLQLRDSTLPVLFFYAAQPDKRLKRLSQVRPLIRMKNRSKIERALLTAAFAALPDVDDTQAYDEFRALALELGKEVDPAWEEAEGEEDPGALELPGEIELHATDEENASEGRSAGDGLSSESNAIIQEGENPAEVPLGKG